MTRLNWPVYSAVAGFCTVALGSAIALALQPAAEPATATMAPVVPVQAAPVQAAPAQVVAGPPTATSAEHSYYDQLRSRVRWVQTTIGGDKLLTPDLDSRLLLAKSAAGRAGLTNLGLGFEDVYGIINAETSWVPRLGASKDGTPNLGIAQFEPVTAKALGLRNPDDPVEAVHVAALHMKEAAIWSAERISGLKLGADEHAAKLREGISIYYNLSTRGRNTWNGRNTHKLPRETQLHIQNARIGARQAEFFEAQLQAMKFNGGKARSATVTAQR